MPLRFRPADTTFYDLFAQSAQHLVHGADLLARMLADGSDREGIARQMRDAEHRADEATHDLIRRVNTTFVTPFDREDIYSLASGLDDVMDYMEEAVDLVLLYEVERLPSELANQVEVLQRCAELKRRHGLADVKMVLITNASMFHRPVVQKGLAILDANQGEIWGKLDAGTADYYHLIDRTKIPFQQILDNLLLAAKARPIVIQSLFMGVNGVPPSEHEIGEYVSRLVAGA